MNKLAIVCMTKFEPFTPPFLYDMWYDAKHLGAQFIQVIDGDGEGIPEGARIHIQSGGYFESAWDAVLEQIDADMIFRLDDDEILSAPLLHWLARGIFTDDVYAFPRVHLWGDEQHCIINSPLYPDLQTRFTTKSKAGGRNQIHVGSPYGTGTLVNHPIEHHKFLVRSRAEREKIAAHYESIRPGAGMSDTYRPFNIPETCYDAPIIKVYANGEIAPH